MFNRNDIFDIKDKSTNLEPVVQDFKNGNTVCNWGIFQRIKNLLRNSQIVFPVTTAKKTLI